jgi:cell wall-associated NlpC family hydrolase
MRTGIWDTGEFRGYPNNVDLQMKWFIKRAKEEQSAGGRDGRSHPERNATLDDAGALGKWADDIERSAFPDRYQAKYTEAKGYIANLAAYVQQNQGSTGGGSVSGTTREKIVYWANYCEQHKDEILYGQGTNIGPWHKPRSGQTADYDLQSKPAGTLPFSTDCSAFVALCYQWAGAPLPPGGFSTATGTLQGAPARRIQMSEALPGDYIIYGSGRGDHAVLVTVAGADPTCVSHGGDSGPLIVQANYRSGGQAWRSLPDGT